MLVDTDVLIWHLRGYSQGDARIAAIAVEHRLSVLHRQRQAFCGGARIVRAGFVLDK